MSAPTVAAIVPCYNTSRYVAEAIASALAQTYGPLEVVVVNDGSTDDFASAVAPFRDRIRLVEQENRGLSAARNRGIDETDAELLAFLDADDRWAPEKIEKQVAFLRERPGFCVVHTGRRFIDSAGAEVARPLLRRVRPAEGNCRLELAKRNSITVSSVLLRRSVLGDDRFAPDLKGCEDWDMWLRLAPRGRFGHLGEVLTDYRLHDASMSRLTERMLEGELATLDRAMGRPAPAAVRAAERARRRLSAMRLAHLVYERGELVLARALFLEAMPPRAPADAIRLAATCLPARILGPARALFRAVLRARDAIAGGPSGGVAAPATPAGVAAAGADLA